jgi:predicted transposase YdaD
VLNANVDTGVFRAKVMEQESKSLTELAMTLADRFRQEGRQEGRMEGRQEGVTSLQKALVEVLDIRFGLVPEGLTETLLAVCDLDRLKTLHRTALTCSDLESFASCL